MNTRNGPFHFHVSHTVPAGPRGPRADLYASDLRKSQQSANEVDVHVACGSARGEHTLIYEIGFPRNPPVRKRPV